MLLSRDIILYHYSFSPYAKRIVWYLNLRRIPYTQCHQPAIMPRPDLSAIGVSYRRIPVMSIGKDIYCDTRLILQKLETLFPASEANPAISASSPDEKTIERLLEFWTVDGGIFARAAQLIPTDGALFKDPKFIKDREAFTGRSWDAANMERMRPEALVEIQSAFKFLEETLLGDGREWVLKTGGASLADIEAVWPYHWLQTMPGALPKDLISATQFPKTFAWIKRFDSLTRTLVKSNGKAPVIKGSKALSLIGSAEYAEATVTVAVDTEDPTGLKAGQEVEVWPIDSGSGNKDIGKLVGLGVGEIVIEGKTETGQTVRIHTPRHGFRLRVLGKEKL